MMNLLKPACVLSVLFVLISLTSCLKDDNDVQPIPRYGLVTVQRDVYGSTLLKNDYGGTFKVSINNSGKDISLMGRAIVVYKMINEDDLADPNKKPWNIDLLSAVGIVRPTMVANGNAETDSLKAKYDDPIIGFDKIVDNGDGAIAKDGYVTVALDYFFSKEIDMNKFILLKDSKAKKGISVNGPDTLNVYLGRNANGDVNGQYRIGYFAQGDINYWPFYYFAFDVAKLIPIDYQKNELVLRINYKKDKTGLNPVVEDAVKLVKYTVKE